MMVRGSTSHDIRPEATHEGEGSQLIHYQEMKMMAGIRRSTRHAQLQAGIAVFSMLKEYAANGEPVPNSEGAILDA